MNSALLAQKGKEGISLYGLFVTISSVKITHWSLEYRQSPLMNELIPIPASAHS